MPEVFDYVTLRTMLYREDFERKSQHLFDKVSAPVERALMASGLHLEDIDQVEIIGGGLRVPRVLELIKEATGK